MLPSMNSSTVLQFGHHFVGEALKSVIESIVDRFGAEHIALSGRVKDYSSLAILLCILNRCPYLGCNLVLIVSVSMN